MHIETEPTKLNDTYQAGIKWFDTDMNTIHAIEEAQSTRLTFVFVLEHAHKDHEISTSCHFSVWFCLHMELHMIQFDHLKTMGPLLWDDTLPVVVANREREAHTGHPRLPPHPSLPQEWSPSRSALDTTIPVGKAGKSSRPLHVNSECEKQPPITKQTTKCRKTGWMPC